jgi:hypothetical protein
MITLEEEEIVRDLTDFADFVEAIFKRIEEVTEGATANCNLDEAVVVLITQRDNARADVEILTAELKRLRNLVFLSKVSA